MSKRSLRPDPNFDALISKIYPSREEYEAHQDRVLIRLSRLHNQQALSSSIEEGLRMQAMHRCGDARRERSARGSCLEYGPDSLRLGRHGVDHAADWDWRASVCSQTS